MFEKKDKDVIKVKFFFIMLIYNVVVNLIDVNSLYVVVK